VTRRLPAIDPAEGTPELRQALDAAEARLGTCSSILRTMANSPAALTGYLALEAVLSHATLDRSLREQIALAVAEANACRQCVQDHIAIGKALGLDESTIKGARHACSLDAKIEAALQFAQKVAEYRGDVTDEEFARMRRAGYSNEEIAEIIANVVLCIYANYFTIIAQPTCS
jgi:uncharacterized peroxidase-related enzyme